MSLISSIGHGFAEAAGEAAGSEVGDAVGRGAVDEAQRFTGGDRVGGESGPERGIGLEEPPGEGSDGGDSVGSFGGVGGFNNGGSDATGSLDDQSDGVTNEANSSVGQFQGVNQQQGATDAQNSLNAAQGQTQTNEQNASAAAATQAAADQGNQLEEAEQLAAAEEKQRHEEIEAAIQSIQ